MKKPQYFALVRTKSLRRLKNKTSSRKIHHSTPPSVSIDDIFGNKYVKHSQYIYMNIQNVLQDPYMNDSQKVNRINNLLVNLKNSSDKVFHPSSVKNTTKESYKKQVTSPPDVYSKVKPSYLKHAKTLLDFALNNSFDFDENTLALHPRFGSNIKVDSVLEQLINQKPSYIEEEDKSVIRNFVEAYGIPNSMIRNREFQYDDSYTKKSNQTGSGYKNETKRSNTAKIGKKYREKKYTPRNSSVRWFS